METSTTFPVQSRSIEHFFHGKKFNNVEDVKNTCTQLVAFKSKDWYQEGIKQLAKRWEQAINSDGLYFMTQGVNIILI